MKIGTCFAAALGMGLALTPWTAIAQAQADQPATPVTEVSIPPDQQPSKEQLAKLFEVMRLRQQLQSVQKMIPAMVRQQMQAQAHEMAAKLPGGGTMTPEQQAAVAKIQDKYLEKAFNIITSDELIDDMTAVYQRHLSRSDVDAFITFYSSPAGQHLLDQQPAIMREYMPVVMKRAQERSKALTDELTKEMAEFTKSIAPATDKPAAK
jgi:hypothetical protein